MKRQKIAILTQAPIGTNYGNTLQAFALQQVLMNFNHEVIVLDRVKSYIYNITHWSLSQFKNEILNVIDHKNRMTPRIFHQIYDEHFKFVHENINVSDRLYDTVDLENDFKKNNYTTVIVGSDQTWRPAYSPNIYNYFLDFLSDNTSIKKIAYASSFGTDQWEFSDEETHKCCHLVQQFDAVSVREKSGVALCKNHLKLEVEWVLDPTFLLSKEEYLKVAHKKDIPKRSGLFSYILDENEQIEHIIARAASILKLDHFTNQPVCRNNDISKKAVQDLRYPSVESWIKAFEDADFVVTNSFHGTVFAIIFKKPFLTIVNKQRGAARFHSLLSEFNLENRLIYEEDEDFSDKIKLPIDFNAVNEKKEALKIKSLEFLNKSLIE